MLQIREVICGSEVTQLCEFYCACERSGFIVTEERLSEGAFLLIVDRLSSYCMRNISWFCEGKLDKKTSCRQCFRRENYSENDQVIVIISLHETVQPEDKVVCCDFCGDILVTVRPVILCPDCMDRICSRYSEELGHRPIDGHGDFGYLSYLENLLDQQKSMIEELERQFESHERMINEQSTINNQCEERSENHIDEIKNLTDKLREVVTELHKTLRELDLDFERLGKRIDELELVLENESTKENPRGSEEANN
ncbi:hypothetical protein QAD02_009704 [Eretmocerus hayati]|uniref:Uncharacterized protein n=2 Tax=Eretmocerus hayati TaxID=131215 RepID=A0ACC2NEK6_9HYME|nr:hypothetical protein QAD02_009703 [Eretmocerus hayati]KAJ8668041.1 hypothetical protein QAD02_009704 [Eretmocerus hayati]